MIVLLILTLLFAYLIGSIPFGLVLTKVFLKQDVRDIGSGNTGATNVLRTGSKKLAAATLLLDMLKGFLLLAIASGFLLSKPDHAELVQLLVMALTGGFVIVIGHCFPIWLKFKGGKGVATALGVLLAAVPITGFVMCLAWIMSFLATRISSLAAITAMIVAPAVTYGIYGLQPALINIAISILVIARHHSNIRRLMKGEEKAFKSS